MLQSLLDLIVRLGHWSYVILFVAATLECAAFGGLVLPEETLVLASGFLARQGVLDLETAIAVVAVGAMLGDNIGYRLGARLGRDWLLQQGARVGFRPARLIRVEEFFARHGANAVFIGRFIGLVRTLIPFVAGASGMPYRQFVVFDALGAILSTAALAVLGYGLGASWYLVERWIGRTSALVAAAVGGLAVVTWLWRRRRARSRTS